MNRKSTYSAFTLVEMLIVMGIIVILMAVGIASGRYAIQRANRIEHQNAADQLYQAAQSYYTDNREFPPQATPGTLVGTGGDLEEYLDEFNGGSDATYTYAVDGTQQQIIICASLGGVDDENELGYYCNGNGLGSASEINGGIVPLVKEISWNGTAYSDVNIEAFISAFAATGNSDWNADTGSF